MRFENKVTIHIHKNNLNTNGIFIPPILIEPFFDNVFIHAFDAKHTNIELMDKIPLTESGKHKFVISKCSPFVNNN